MHRLWYDLRTQSMFETDLRTAVLEIDATLEQMIWRVVGTVRRAGRRPPAFDAGTTYSLLDGIFEKALLAHITGADDALRVAAPPRPRRAAHAARALTGTRRRRGRAVGAAA